MQLFLINLKAYSIMVVYINLFITMNRYAYTLGMREVLNSNKIRLYCRNGANFDWANTILRIALFGTPGDDYPVTHMRNHPNYAIITDKDTLATPKNLI